MYNKDENHKTFVKNTIDVPYGKRFKLHLSDGTMVHLNSGSSFTYPVSFIDGIDREVFLSGEAFFDVSSDSLNTFKVVSTGSYVEVYGTKFNFKDYQEDNFSEIILTEGSLGVKNTINNFNKFQNIGEKIKIIKNKKIKRISNTINQLGFDLTYCIKQNSKNYIASLKNKKTNIQLDFYSNLPGVQLYTSQGLRYKNKLAPYQGICLETQHYPDAPNNKNFPSTLIKPNKLYKYFTKINIS